ncbi:hypothetical protein ACHQM5_002995 [Ranunculus cassubicifolius]
MGCCLSKDPDFNSNPKPQFPHSSRRRPFQESEPHPIKAPLSPVFEEESVKEVLSETPNPKPLTQPEQVPRKPNPVQELLKKQEAIEEDDNGSKMKIPPIAEIPKLVVEEKKIDVVNNNNNVVASEEYSEVSEICSLSESQSLSTTTINTERKDDEDGEVQQPRSHHRSPAKVLRKRSIPGEFVGKYERGSKSPARRLNNPSPGRRHDTNPDVTQATRRRIAENNRVIRREPGERSGRRSRSPATRINPGSNRNGIGRSPSRKAAPRSPARAHPATVAPESERKVEGEEKPTNESMENPLVSLECFIFL